MLPFRLRSAVKSNVTDVKPALHGRGLKVGKAILYELVQLAAGRHQIQQSINAALALQHGKYARSGERLSVTGWKLSAQPATCQVFGKLDDIPLAFARVLTEWQGGHSAWRFCKVVGPPSEYGTKWSHSKRSGSSHPQMAHRKS